MTDDALPIRIVGGAPTDEETAAIAALFSTLLLERSVSTEALPRTTARSEWERSKRAVRVPWTPGQHWQDR